MEYKINQSLSKNSFKAVSEDKTIGIIEFLLTDNSINITHTGVLPEYEGLGIAANLNKELLEYAIKENLKVIPTCSYTRTYIERHPQYKALV